MRIRIYLIEDLRHECEQDNERVGNIADHEEFASISYSSEMNNLVRE